MILPNKYKNYFEKVPTDGKITLKDVQTKLFILVKNEMYIVKVDDGIVQNTRDGIKSVII